MQCTDASKKAALNKIVDDINAERSKLGNKANDYLGDNSVLPPLCRHGVR